MADFVTFDIAKKLKEKGFNWKVYAYYGIHDNRFNVHPAKDMNDCEYRCSAPTISQVLKWLREGKNIHISIMLFMFQEGWCYEITQIGKNPKLITTQRNSCNTYEEAAIAGIEYVIDNLI